MVVGVSPKAGDIVVNVCKRKQLTNTRASGSDEALRLTPPVKMSLEKAIEYIADDELLEVTPLNIRIRKRQLDHAMRMRELKKAEVNKCTAKAPSYLFFVTDKRALIMFVKNLISLST
jgi:GTP-binding protein